MEQQDAKLIKQRQRKKKMKYGGIAFAITVIVTAIVILVNVVVGLLVEPLTISKTSPNPLKLPFPARKAPWKRTPI